MLHVRRWLVEAHYWDKNEKALTTEPLRIKEVEVAKGGVLVVQQEPVLVQELGRLVELGPVPELELVLRKQVPADGRLVLLLVQHWIASLKTTTSRMLFWNQCRVSVF